MGNATQFMYDYCTNLLERIKIDEVLGTEDNICSLNKYMEGLTDRLRLQGIMPPQPRIFDCPACGRRTVAPVKEGVFVIKCSDCGGLMRDTETRTHP